VQKLNLKDSNGGPSKLVYLQEKSSFLFFLSWCLKKPLNISQNLAWSFIFVMRIQNTNIVF